MEYLALAVVLAAAHALVLYLCFVLPYRGAFMAARKQAQDARESAEEAQRQQDEIMLP